MAFISRGVLGNVLDLESVVISTIPQWIPLAGPMTEPMRAAR